MTITILAVALVIFLFGLFHYGAIIHQKDMERRRRYERK